MPSFVKCQGESRVTPLPLVLILWEGWLLDCPKANIHLEHFQSWFVLNGVVVCSQSQSPALNSSCCHRLSGLLLIKQWFQWLAVSHSAKIHVYHKCTGEISSHQIPVRVLLSPDWNNFFLSRRNVYSIQLSFSSHSSILPINAMASRTIFVADVVFRVNKAAKRED